MDINIHASLASTTRRGRRRRRVARPSGTATVAAVVAMKAHARGARGRVVVSAARLRRDGVWNDASGAGGWTGIERNHRRSGAIERTGIESVRLGWTSSSDASGPPSLT
jgi:hypothetical protein